MELKRIASFEVNHNVLERGIYISRIDKDITTYDIRMKLPNKNDYLATAAMHTIEHIVATFVRNSAYSDRIIYFGPMGCRTGFYFLTRDSVSYEDAISIVYSSMNFVKDFEGEIPGTTAEECGNYKEHDLEGAKEIAADMAEVLSNWNEEKLYY